MPIEALRLQNFMAFADTGWIELRKINLLLGRNSSGKSVIIRALRLMKQSLLANDGKQPLVFIAEEGIDLGSFNETVHRATEKKRREDDQQEDSVGDEAEERWSDPITFGFRGTFAKESDIIGERLLWPAWVRHLGLSEKTTTKDLLFEVSISYRQDKWSKEVFVWKVETSATNRNSPEEVVPIWGFDIIDSDFSQLYPYIFSSVLSDSIAELNEYLEISSFREFLPNFKPLSNSDETTIDWPDQIEAVALFWRECKVEISRLLESIVYVGPIRPLPEYTYTITQELYDNWLIKGWQPFLNYLIQEDEERDQKINRWFQLFKFGHALYRNYEIQNRVGNIIRVLHLELDETGHGDMRNLINVGFGASQILPIIVQCVSAASDALVLIEQPELHLHPEAQADVADLFIESVNEIIPSKSNLHPKQVEKHGVLPKRVEGDAVSRRYIIETHSETMFLRFRVELARTTANTAREFFFMPKDLVCYYIERDNANGISTSEQMLFDEKGEFEKRPAKFFDFFGQDFKETMALKKARSLKGK